MKNALQSLLLGSVSSDTRTFDLVYAIFRFYCGISIAIGAGLSKVFHKIDESGSADWSNLAIGIPEWFVKQVGDLGFTFISPHFWAALATYGEFAGGLLIAVGLFTRISAFQMAFQFFIVSFIWYDEPVPFAMYYQQLIFWSFVLIAAVGGGYFSLDRVFAKRLAVPKLPSTGIVAGAFLLLAPSGYSQNAGAQAFFSKTGTPERVNFTLSNPSLKSMEVDIRCFDYARRKCIGYGCRVGFFASRSDNKPVGTRIYVKNGGQWRLKYVLTAMDNGLKIDLTETYPISKEQWQQVALDEQSEQAVANEDDAKNPDMDAVARALHLDMVAFKISTNSVFGKQVHVRAQLPYDKERSNNGFSRRLAFFQTQSVRYPVGTKIYACDGAYWNGEVPEKLILTVDVEKANYLIRL